LGKGKKESIENHTYAKLTLAKTIGDTELKTFMCVLFYKKMTCLAFGYSATNRRSREFSYADEAFMGSYMNNPF
jgi:hypothetical protein